MNYRKQIFIITFISLFCINTIFANAPKDVKDMTFGENILESSCFQGTALYCPKFQNNQYYTGFQLTFLFFNVSCNFGNAYFNGEYNDPNYYWDVSCGPNLNYFITNNLSVHTNLNFGYYEQNYLKSSTYSSWDDKYYNHYETEGKFLVDYKIGLGLDLGISDIAALLTVDVGVNNSYGPYFNLGVGFRACNEKYAKFMKGLCEGLSEGARGAVGNYSNSGSGYTMHIKSGDSKIGYTYFYNVTVYNNSYSSIEVNGTSIWSGQSRSFYSSDIWIESNSRVNITYDKSGSTLYLYIK